MARVGQQGETVTQLTPGTDEVQNQGRLGSVLNFLKRCITWGKVLSIEARCWATWGAAVTRPYSLAPSSAPPLRLLLTPGAVFSFARTPRLSPGTSSFCPRHHPASFPKTPPGSSPCLQALLQPAFSETACLPTVCLQSFLCPCVPQDTPNHIRLHDFLLYILFFASSCYSVSTMKKTILVSSLGHIALTGLLKDSG